MAQRYYANAAATALSGSCTALDTTITVDSVTGLPIQYPYVMILDRGTGTEEVVLVTNASGTDLTVSRGYDSTTAFAHSLGAEAVHGVAAIDHREANTHVNATSGVHGVSGDVVGTSDTQTISNKDLSDPTNTFPSSLATEVEVTSAVETAIDDHDAETVVHGATGAVVGTTNSQTLTNKTISTDDNDISGLAASSFAVTDGSGVLDGSAAAKAIPAGVVVGTTDSQTLTNKTLTAPTITSPTITGPGQVLTAVKTANETVTSSTALQDDDELTVAIPGTGTYIIMLNLMLDSGVGSGGFKVALDYDGTFTTFYYNANGPTPGEFAFNNTTSTHEVTTDNTAINIGADNVFTGAQVYGCLLATGAGDLTLRWAQVTSDPQDSTVRALSWMRVERVA